MGVGIQVDKLNAWFGKTQALQDINMTVAANHATAVIGPPAAASLPSCAASTACTRRFQKPAPQAGCASAKWTSTTALQRCRFAAASAWSFRRPNPFPTMSIYDNVAAGLTLNGFHDRKRWMKSSSARSTLSALWDEVKDTMRKKSGASLSGGQQQRLCIARALAVEPQVLLMDEPCSALDPISTGKIEELIFQLKERFTIVIVTHNMQQASRVADLKSSHV